MRDESKSRNLKFIAGRLLLAALVCVLVASASAATVLAVRTARDLAVEGCITFARG